MFASACRAAPGLAVSVILGLPPLALSANTAVAAEILPGHGSVSHAPVRTARTQRFARRAAAHRATCRPVAASASTADVAATDVAAREVAASTAGAADWQQIGTASWYGGSRWHGNRTSSGAIYDENALTAAHASLPMGARVRVSLVGSDRSIVVTITDRPGTRTRIIDLSRGAAEQLGILSRGVAQVKLSRL